MSHFTVLVIGNNVEEQLQPYHEFECTGTDDKYVKDIDITEQVRDEYNKRTQTMYVSPLGHEHDAYEDRFYRDFTAEEKSKNPHAMGTGCGNGISYTSKDWNDGLGYRAKVHFLPEGWSEIEVPVSKYKTLLEHIEDYHGYEPKKSRKSSSKKEEKGKYGYVVVDDDNNVVKVIRRTNPNDKWDWWTVGGRWTGFFKAKDKYNPKNDVGRPGLMTQPAKPGWYDQILKGNVDIEGMRAKAYKAAIQNYEIIESYMGGKIPKVEVKWKEILDGEKYKHLDYEQKREFYWGQEGLVIVQKVQAEIRKSLGKRRPNEDEECVLWFEIEEFQCTKEEYATNERNEVLQTFAVVKDGKWYEKGEMGWWACVSNKKDEEVWAQEFATLIDEVSDDTLLTIVDCHI